MFNKLIISLSFTCALLLTSISYASLIGDTVNARLTFSPDPNQYFFPKPIGAGFTDSAEAVIGAGDDFFTNLAGLTPSGLVQITADFGASTLRIDYTIVNAATSFPSHDMVFSDLDWVGTPGIITGFAWTSTNLSAPPTTSFTADSLTINMGALGVDIDKFITFDIETAHVPVPEPETYLLMGSFSFLLLYLSKHKKKKLEVQ
jgi:hypothetical protein